MQGIDKWSVAAGIVFIIVGVTVSIIALYSTPFFLIHAAIALIVGIVILTTLHKQEHIEPIKHSGKNIKKTKKTKSRKRK